MTTLNNKTDGSDLYLLNHGAIMTTARAERAKELNRILLVAGKAVSTFLGSISLIGMNAIRR
jgi:hypothetical protein